MLHQLRLTTLSRLPVARFPLILCLTLAGLIYSLFAPQPGPFAIQVVKSDGAPAVGASVAWLAPGSLKLEWLVDAHGERLTTDADGYIYQPAPLPTDAQVVAGWPAYSAPQFGVYHTNLAVTPEGWSTTAELGEKGVKARVSAENPLILFDLSVSLAWDARSDPDYLAQLSQDLRAVSRTLYAISGGQIALDDVRVYLDRQHWAEADILIHATPDLLPSAAMGGIVTEPTTVTLGQRSVTFFPGQVQMGVTWNRFGNQQGRLGEDWPRALAHELGHYLLYLSDDYLGFSADGMAQLVDCPGSFMSDPYDPQARLLDPAAWDQTCQQSIAGRTTGLSDWETVLTLYPWLQERALLLNAGLPDLTQIQVLEPDTPLTALLAPIFPLVNPDGAPAQLHEASSRAYLFKNWGDSAVTRRLIDLGAPRADQVWGRGAAPGDRLCVFEHTRTITRRGCLMIGPSAQPVVMRSVAGWQPMAQIVAAGDVLQVTLRTGQTADWHMQFLAPAAAPSRPVRFELHAGDWIGQVQQPDPAWGYAYLWAPDAPDKELIVPFSVGQWGPSRGAWDAPTSSDNGELLILSLATLFDVSPPAMLHALPAAPGLPAWAYPISRAYAYQTEAPTAGSLLFHYFQRYVPGGEAFEVDTVLSVYYSADSGATWRALPTHIDARRNVAASSLAGPGYYVLVSSVGITLQTGWNLITYPLPGDTPTGALTTAPDAAFTIIYAWDDAAWSLFDRQAASQAEWADLVNDLSVLRFGVTYFAYATRPATLYFDWGTMTYQELEIPLTPAPDESLPLRPQSILPLHQPPIVFYGEILQSSELPLNAGLVLHAWSEGALCGEGRIMQYQDHWVYRLLVQPQAAGCTAAARSVQLELGGHFLTQTLSGDNTRAHYRPLVTGFN